METYIRFNRWTFYGRIIFIIPITWLLYKPILNVLDRPYNASLIMILVFFICFVLALVLFLVVGLFFKPIGVTIDYGNRLLWIKYIVRNPKKIEIAEIEGYSTTLLWTKAKKYKGLLLYLNDNHKVDLTDYNIKSHVPILDFLRGAEVKYFGDETSWFPFRPLTYKYQKH